jgi:hypothetical protein
MKLLLLYNGRMYLYIRGLYRLIFDLNDRNVTDFALIFSCYDFIDGQTDPAPSYGRYRHLAWSHSLELSCSELLMSASAERSGVKWSGVKCFVARSPCIYIDSGSVHTIVGPRLQHHPPQMEVQGSPRRHRDSFKTLPPADSQTIAI